MVGRAWNLGLVAWDEQPFQGDTVDGRAVDAEFERLAQTRIAQRAGGRVEVDGLIGDRCRLGDHDATVPPGGSDIGRRDPLDHIQLP